MEDLLYVEKRIEILKNQFGDKSFSQQEIETLSGGQGEEVFNYLVEQKIIKKNKTNDNYKFV